MSLRWVKSLAVVFVLCVAGSALQSRELKVRPTAANVWKCNPDDLKALCELADQDQADRQSPIDWNKVTPKDETRKLAVLKMIGSIKLNTPGDYFHAALIMQHGVTWEDYGTAHQLSMRGLQISPRDPNLQRMVAASWDRMMHALGHKQWFGTNSFRNADGSKMEKETRPDLIPHSLIDLWSRPWVWPEE
jgi:hypothetical protein